MTRGTRLLFAWLASLLLLSPPAMATDLTRLSLEELMALAANLSPSEREYLLEGMCMNQAAGSVGLKECPGTGYGAHIARLMEEGVLADDVAGLVPDEA